MRTAAAFIVTLILAQSVASAEPRFAFPLDCLPGNNCWVVNYVDRDPAPGAMKDYSCGRATYDDHKGTDFAIGSGPGALRPGTDVLAAAAGKVLRVRNGEPDGLSPALRQRARENGVECGNGLVIEHTDGWATQYCHMKRASILVRPGESVGAGQTLGQVGLSGMTEFPHLHFQVTRNGSVIDPFAAEPANEPCSPKPTNSLWQEDARTLLQYRLSQIYNAGFSGQPPKWAQVQRQTRPLEALRCDVPALITWVEAYNARAGDKLETRIFGPDGELLLDRGEVIEKSQARIFRFNGKKRRAPCWPAGTYRAEHVMLGGPAFEQVLSERSTEIRVTTQRHAN